MLDYMNAYFAQTHAERYRERISNELKDSRTNQRMMTRTSSELGKSLIARLRDRFGRLFINLGNSLIDRRKSSSVA